MKNALYALGTAAVLVAPSPLWSQQNATILADSLAAQALVDAVLSQQIVSPAAQSNRKLLTGGVEYVVRDGADVYTVQVAQMTKRTQLAFWSGSGANFRVFTDFTLDGKVDVAAGQSCTQDRCQRLRYQRPTEDLAPINAEAEGDAQTLYGRELRRVMRALRISE